MKLDMTEELIGLDKATIPVSAENKTPLTLRLVAISALQANFDHEQVGGDEKLKRFNLAQKCYENDTVDLPANEIMLIRQLVGLAYSPAVVGPAYKILDALDD